MEKYHSVHKRQSSQLHTQPDIIQYKAGVASLEASLCPKSFCKTSVTTLLQHYHPHNPECLDYNCVLLGLELNSAAWRPSRSRVEIKKDPAIKQIL